MENNTYEIQLKDGKQAIEMLKLGISAMMMKWKEVLLSLDYPQPEDYDSEVEYKEMYKQYMQEIIDDVRDVKEDIFKTVLDSYNQFLSAKKEMETQLGKENKESMEMIERANYDLKKTGIITIGVTLVFPSSLPFILLINIPRVGSDLYARRKHQLRLEKNAENLEYINAVQDPFFEFTDTLRTDYHKTNREIKELKQKANQGEFVLEELQEMFNPERLALPTIEESPLIELDFKTDEAVPKKLEKK